MEIAQAPQNFNGSLEEFFHQWGKQVLLAPKFVEEFHKDFLTYYFNEKDPIYLIRMVQGLEREVTIQADSGAKIRATDNSPAWYVHYQIYSGHYREFPSFSNFIDKIPCHIFRIQMPENINQAGWHVAHIFDVKDRNLNFNSWDRKELLRRTARNIHPCNYFYLPSTNWQIWGSNQEILSFYYERFSTMYRSVWNEYLDIVGGSPFPHFDPSDLIYSFSENLGNSDSEDRVITKNEDQIREILKDCKCFYKHTRLCFKGDLIEPLQMNDRFGIITDVGIFKMTKDNFYTVFQNVVKSKSYKEEGIYHYPVVPKKALQFREEINEL
jgi:hypothetical protein